MRCVLPTAEKSAHRWRCEKNCIARLQWAEPSIDRDGRGEKTAGDVKVERGQFEQASVEPKGECDIGNGEAFRPHPPYLVFYVGIEPADRIKAEGRIREHAWRAAYPFDRAASAFAIQPLRTIADEGASIDNVEHTAGQIGVQQQPVLGPGNREQAAQVAFAECAL